MSQTRSASIIGLVLLSFATLPVGLFASARANGYSLETLHHDQRAGTCGQQIEEFQNHAANGSSTVIAFGRLLLQSGCSREAIRILESIAVPDNPSIQFRKHLYLGAAYAEISNYVKMNSHWLEIGAYRLMHRVAKDQLDANNVDEARSVYAAIPPSSLSDFRLSYDIGSTLIGIDKALALKFLKRTVELQKNEWNTMLLIGDLYLASGRYSEAMRWYSKAIDVEGNNPEPWLRLANGSYLLEDYDQMLVFLHNAQDIDYDSYEVYYSYAKYFSATGRHDNAIDSICKAIALAPPTSTLAHYEAVLTGWGGNCPLNDRDK